MKLFLFTAQRYIEAETLEEAEDLFADSSSDFAANAEAKEVDQKTLEPLAEFLCQLVRVEFSPGAGELPLS